MLAQIRKRRGRPPRPEGWGSGVVDIEARRESQRAWRARNRERIATKNARHRARRHGGLIGNATPEQMAARWAFFGGRCWMCGGEADTWDHVKPLAEGGAHLACNLRPACRSCNSRKGDQWEAPRVRVA